MDNPTIQEQITFAHMDARNARDAAAALTAAGHSEAAAREIAYAEKRERFAATLEASYRKDVQIRLRSR